eukprot:1410726-Prymnesium_polylepis.1
MRLIDKCLPQGGASRKARDRSLAAEGEGFSFKCSWFWRTSASRSAGSGADELVAIDCGDDRCH